MNTSEKRRPAPGPGLRSSNRTSMPAPPPRAAMAASNNTTTTTPDSPTEAGGAPLKDKDTIISSQPTTTGSSSTGRAGKDHHDREKRKREKKSERDAMLRDRDERIAYLEREMETMEREFTKELDKLSQNESETATFWQAKHSTLNQQFLRTDTELRLLRAEVDVRTAEREELREGWEVLRRELKERDDEVRGLRGQVRGLKEWVSTSTRTDGQTSDEVFGDGMTRLGNGLQNWVIVNFRKAKLSTSIPPMCMFHPNSPYCRSRPSRRSDPRRTQRTRPHVRRPRPHSQTPPSAVHRIADPRRDGIRCVLCRSLRGADAAVSTDGEDAV